VGNTHQHIDWTAGAWRIRRCSSRSSSACRQSSTFYRHPPCYSDDHQCPSAAVRLLTCRTFPYPVRCWCGYQCSCTINRMLQISSHHLSRAILIHLCQIFFVRRIFFSRPTLILYRLLLLSSRLRMYLYRAQRRRTPYFVQVKVMSMMTMSETIAYIFIDTSSLYLNPYTDQCTDKIIYIYTCRPIIHESLAQYVCCLLHYSSSSYRTTCDSYRIDSNRSNANAILHKCHRIMYYILIRSEVFSPITCGVHQVRSNPQSSPIRNVHTK